MRVQFSPGGTSAVSVMLLSAIMAMKADDPENPDITTLTDVLLDPAYCREPDIEAITSLITNASNVTIEQSAARIEVNESTTIVQLSVSSTGVLYIA